MQPRREADAQNIAQQRQIKPDLAENQPVAVARTEQNDEQNQAADGLGYNSRHGRARHAHPEGLYEQDIEHYIAQTAENQHIQRAARIADRAENARADVVNQHENYADKVNAHVCRRAADHVLRRVHHAKPERREQIAQHGKRYAAQQRHGDGRMYAARDAVWVVRAVMLRDDYGRAAGKADEEADQQVDQRACGTAHGGKRFLAHKVAHDDCVGRVVQLLEERPQHDGKEKLQQLLPDYAFGDSVMQIHCLFRPHKPFSVV